MADNFEGKAIGIFELDSYLSCIVAVDAAAKAADIKVQGVERNRLKSGACAKIRGSISNVNAAMEAALKAATNSGAEITSHTIIASPMGCEDAISMTINK